MTDTNTLRIDSVSRGPILYVRLYGAIDETFDVQEILAAGTGKDVILNTKAVTRISSFGVREWVHAMSRLAEVKNRIILVDCSPVLVKQLNLVANFADHCDVVSILAPYYCEPCGWDTEVTLAVSEDGVVQPSGLIRCSRCETAMVLDEEPSLYFRFAKPDRFRPLDPHIAEFIRSYLEAGEGERQEGPPEAASRPVATASPPAARGQAARIWYVAIPSAVILILAVVLAVIFLTGQRGIPTEVLEDYHQRLASEDFAGAERVVATLRHEDGISKDLVSNMLKSIASKRSAARHAAVAEGRRLQASKQYAAAIARFERGLALGADVSARFSMAEAYRRLGQKEDAYQQYRRFSEEIGDFRDRHLDDALYWQADYLVYTERTDEARVLLQRIVKELPKSNYKKPAARLLATLD